MKRSEWNEAMNQIDTDLVDNFMLQQQEILQRKRKKVLCLRFGMVAACFLLVFAAFAGYFAMSGEQSKVAATIMLDVNPSLEIKVDENERVLAVVPLNEDAEKIVTDLDAESDDLIETVDAIILSMIDNGYLDEIKNAVLMSIACEDEEKADMLSAKLSERIMSMLGSDGTVLTQTVKYKNNKDKRIAQEYGVSYGKYYFIQEILKLYPELEFEDLVIMSVSDMKILVNNMTTEKGINQRFINLEKAIQIAMNHFQITDNSRIHELSLDIRYVSLFESNVGYNEGLVYSLSFEEVMDDRHVAYRISLNPFTGDIIRGASTSWKRVLDPPHIISDDEIDIMEAFGIAYQEIGISVDDGHSLSCTYIEPSTIYSSFWNIQINYNDIIYEIGIDGKTGNIMYKELIAYLNGKRIVIDQWFLK